jgi:hypothetical protein
MTDGIPSVELASIGPIYAAETTGKDVDAP